MILLTALLAGATMWTTLLAVSGRPLTITRRPAHKPRGVDRREWLQQAGAPVTPLQFVGVSAVCGATALVVCLAVSGTVIVALVPAVVVALAPWAYWSGQRRQRNAALGEAWPEAIRGLLAALGRGLTVHQGLVELSVTGPLPLRPVLARYAALERRVGPPAALEQVRRELADIASDRVLLAVGLALTEGRELVIAILGVLADEAAADLQAAEKIHTAAITPTVAAWACGLIPVGLLVLLCASQSFYRHFYSTPAGVALVVAGVGSLLTGGFIVRRMGRPAPEHRIFDTKDNSVAHTPDLDQLDAARSVAR